MIYAVNFADSLADILAEHLLDKFKSDPFALAHVKIILPTRRSCQVLRESFLEKNKESATLLPQMLALYDMDDPSVELPSAISNWERLFLLTKLCQAKPNLKETSKAFQVALSLAELLDLSYQYNVSFSNLANLVPSASFAQHWQETITFLDIIQTQWPKILKEHNVIDQQDRLQRIIRIKAKEIQKQNEYVVIAGLTSDLPAVGELMKAVQVKGDIFLDGVDQTFIKSDCHPDKHHPQYLIYKTIKTLNIPLKEIIFKSIATPKEELIEQAFRSDVWQKTNLTSNAFQGLKYVVSETAEQEALTIALVLRQVLETPNKTASFVTTDRNLARRVIAQMKRWQIRLDDSAGIPFKHTPVGSFLLQILNLAENNHICERLALYKHPLFADGKNPSKLRIHIKQAEKKARKEHQEFDFKLEEDGTFFLDLFKNNELLEFSELFKRHIQLAEKWATTDIQEGHDVLWQNPIGKQLHQTLMEILNQSALLGKISTHEYPSLFATLLNFQGAHQSYGYQKRLKILGPIEARFTHTDLCIIGGLNEQIFPPLPDTGPWLNRPMRDQLGLPDTEARITSLTHDFMHLAASKEVILSRCLKIGGTPTVASRFLQRLEMVAQINGLEIPTFQSHLAELVDIPEKVQPVVRPCPCPKADIRPSKLSVTNIELLKRNPYAIYAKYILSLYPLDDWDNPAKASLYGQAVHDTLAQMVQNYDDDKNAILLFHQNLANTHLPTSDCLFYESLFQNSVWPFFKEQQKLLAPQKYKTYSEIQGQVQLNIANKPFMLTARMDRADISPHQSAIVIDYKTGTPPGFSKVLSGLSPQLTLEAWMLLKNGFKDIKVTQIDDIEYWHVGRHPKRQSFTKSQKEKMEDVIQKTEDGLKELLNSFSDEKTPYEVEPVKDFANNYDDYAHLSRKKEWAHADEGEENG